MCENFRVLRVGEEVPDFRIETFEPAKGDFGEITLESLKKEGKWTVLFFYPADFTFVCATEFSDLAEQYENIRGLNTEVITVSRDTKFVHLAWQREEKLLEKARYPMGSDPTGNLSKLFGVYDENTGQALRGTFIISPKGVLLGSEVNFYNVGRNSGELIRKIQANVYVSEHGGEVCPAKWVKGEKTLKPSAELVGRVYEALK